MNITLIISLYVVFVLGVASFLWPYTGYPLTIYFLSKIKRRRITFDGNYKPLITLLVPCYNESAVIRNKLEGSLELDYPSDCLQILVVDSGSTDNTREIVKEYLNQGIDLLIQKDRLGKASGINFALDYARGEIIVVTDADAYLEKDTMRNIVGYFSDPQVGIVGGRVFTRYYIQSAETKGTSILRLYEDFLSDKESIIDSTVNLGGELMAIRKNLARVDESSLSEDFDCLLNARANGYRVIQALNASVWEYAPTDEHDVVIQKKRVAIGTIQSLLKYKNMLFNPRYGLFGFFILPSHKLFQIINPILLQFVIVYSAFLYLLTYDISLFYLLIAEFILALLSTLSYLLKLNYPPLNYLRYFMIIQFSIIGAWSDYLFGKYSVNWEKANSKRLANV